MQLSPDIAKIIIESLRTVLDIDNCLIILYNNAFLRYDSAIRFCFLPIERILQISCTSCEAQAPR